jgi:hypothetical protein
MIISAFFLLADDDFVVSCSARRSRKLNTNLAVVTTIHL